MGFFKIDCGAVRRELCEIHGLAAGSEWQAIRFSTGCDNMRTKAGLIHPGETVNTDGRNSGEFLVCAADCSCA